MLREELRGRVQAAGKRGLAERLAADLVGRPYLSAPEVAHRYGVSKQGAHNAIRSLAKLGILTEAGDARLEQRDRLRRPRGGRGRRLLKSMTDYRDLFDMEQRPGAGLGLWTGVVERQLGRVRDANYRHRLHHSPVASEHREDPGAEDELKVYLVPRALQVQIGIAPVIEGGCGPQVNTGRLQTVQVREITEAEAEELRSREA